MNRETMGQRLRALRKQAGLTQSKFATRCNIDKKTYCRIERDNTINPQLFTIAELAKRLGVSLDYLVFGVRTPTLYTTHGDEK